MTKSELFPQDKGNSLPTIGAEVIEAFLGPEAWNGNNYLVTGVKDFSQLHQIKYLLKDAPFNGLITEVLVQHKESALSDATMLGIETIIQAYNWRQQGLVLTSMRYEISQTEKEEGIEIFKDVFYAKDTPDLEETFIDQPRLKSLLTTIIETNPKINTKTPSDNVDDKDRFIRGAVGTYKMLGYFWSKFNKRPFLLD